VILSSPYPLAGQTNTSVSSTPTATPDLISAMKALDQADPGYQKAHQYYTGEISEVFASVRLRRAMLRTGIAFRFNFAKMPVNILIERLKLAAVTATPDSADASLQALWKLNKLGRLSRQIMRRAAEYGDAYGMVWRDEESGEVDVFYNSPRSVRVFYDPERPNKKLYAIKRWQVTDAAGNKSVRADLFYPDRIEKYVSIVTTGQKKLAWTSWTDEDGDDWPYENPYGQIPIFHFKTDDPYGTPEHKDFYGPQDAIHKLALSHIAGVDYQAFPQRYALQLPDSDTNEPAAADADEFAFASGTGASEPEVEDRSQFQADPGSLWLMKGMSGVGQFDTADHNNFTEPMITYLKFGAQITNTPLHRIDPTSGAPSGESLRQAEAPFVAKVEDRQVTFGDTWEELLMFALQVAETPAASVDIQWDPAQTVNDLEGWNTVAAKISSGLPAEQAFREAGYSAEQIEKWFPDDTDLQTAAQLLLLTAQALASLGTAVSLGAVSDAQVQALIASILGDPDGDGVADIMDPDDAGPKAEEIAAGIEARMAAQAPAAIAPPPPVPDGGDVAP